MAVVIRLRKEGKRNRPYFRVVVTDKESPRDGRFLELVGTYNPMGKDEGMKLKLDRIDHWVGQGAKPSETVASFIRKARRAPKAWKIHPRTTSHSRYKSRPSHPHKGPERATPSDFPGIVPSSPPPNASRRPRYPHFHRSGLCPQP